MELKEQTYWLVHLRNGVTLYTKHQPAIEPGMNYVQGLDEEPYYFPQDAVVLIHRSTPESRAYYIRLTVSLQEEMQGEKAALMEKLMAEHQRKAQEHGMGAKDHVGSALDAARARPGPRPVD